MIGLDFERCFWVKAYRGGGVDWRALPWEAQAIYRALWLEVDHLGRLRVGALGPVAAIAGATGIPAPVVEQHLNVLVMSRGVTLNEHFVTLCDFVPGQQARQSAASRKQKQREKEAQTPPETPPAPPQKPVTEGPPDVTPRDLDQRDLREEKREELSLRSSSADDDARASASARTRAARPKSAPKPDLETSALAPRALAAYEALVADPSLAPICPRPAELARDLADIAPGVDLPLEVRKAGAWLRANPTRRKSLGGRFLTTWVQRAQERLPGPHGPAGGRVVGLPYARAEPPPAQALPRPFAPAPPDARARLAALADRKALPR